jgi:cob(I)alamin adenosyltransferase
LEKEIGIVQVITGDGRGKTTSAIGTAVRAAGYRKKVMILQFIKGDWHYGELDGLAMLAPYIEIEKCGVGFYKIMGDDKPEELHRKAADAGVARAKETIHSGDYHLVILDEINNAIHDGLVDPAAIIDILSSRPADVHVILTGRNAKEEIMEIADMVSEISDIKHPYKKGIMAQKGFDYENRRRAEWNIFARSGLSKGSILTAPLLKPA